MRAPLIALAVVCAAATTAFIVFHHSGKNYPGTVTKTNLPAVHQPVPASPQIPPLIGAVEKAPVLQKPVRSHFIKNRFAWIKPGPTQTAVITSQADTVVHFAQGTEISVAPSDFVSAKTGQPIAGPVKIQVQEFYNMEDILLHNLTTQTKDGLLETNGMINVQAFAQNGEAVVLKKDGKVEIRFPKKNLRNGMQLFRLVKGNSGEDVWEPMGAKANAIPTRKAKIDSLLVGDTLLNSIAVFPGGLAGIEKNINSVSDSFPIKGLNDFVIVDFNVESSGDVGWMQRIIGRDDDYYNALYEALQHMEGWKPAIAKGRLVPMTMRLMVKFSTSNPRIMTFYSCTKSPKQMVEKVIDYRQFRESTSDYTPGYSKKLMEYYTFTSSELGMINCDRFYNSPEPKIELYVKTPVEENMNVQLVFHSIKSVMNANFTGKDFYFLNVPKGEAVTLVAIKGEKNNLQMAIKTFTVRDTRIDGLEFKNVTAADVKASLEQFNQLPGAVAKN